MNPPLSVTMDSPTDGEIRMPHGTLVLSLGNPLRHDDGVGSAVVKQLASMDCLPQDVTLVDGGGAGLDLILRMQDFRRVILVDAADLGLQAGEWACISLSISQAKYQCADRPTSAHILGLAETLNIGRAMGLLPPEILFFGVQPRETGWFPGLSECVQSAVQEICARIAEALTNALGSDVEIHARESCSPRFEPSAVIISTAQEIRMRSNG